jgi:hypothetical protein
LAGNRFQPEKVLNGVIFDEGDLQRVAGEYGRRSK